MTYRLFIGSNNTTHEVETDKIEATLNKYLEGYTIERSLGYWKGQRENSVVVTATVAPRQLPGIIRELKQVLAQEAIAFQRTSELQFA